MERRAIFAAVLLLGLFVSSCTAHKTDPGLGMRVLDCVVVEREHEGPGSSGSSYRGSGNYYLVFETREGQATARYHLPVTQQQWYRFPEGSKVRITLRNNILVDIRPNE